MNRTKLIIDRFGSYSKERIKLLYAALLASYEMDLLENNDERNARKAFPAFLILFVTSCESLQSRVMYVPR